MWLPGRLRNWYDSDMAKGGLWAILLAAIIGVLQALWFILSVLGAKDTAVEYYWKIRPLLGSWLLPAGMAAFGILLLFVDFERRKRHTPRGGLQISAQGTVTPPPQPRDSAWLEIFREKCAKEEEIAALEAKIPHVRVRDAVRLGKDEIDLLEESIARKKAAVRELNKRLKH